MLDVGLFVALVLVWPGCATSPAEVATAQNPAGKPGRVSSQLMSLHEAYEASQQSGATFPPIDTSARVADGRVLIDATAENDADALRADLVALGMQRAIAYGRVVSGELPIQAIPSLETLSSLRFATTATPVLRGRTPPPRYRQ